MAANDPTSRSPELLSRYDSGLLVVDLQGKLLGLIPNSTRVVWNIRRLMEGARVFAIPDVVTEQNPEKLGSTTPDLPLKTGTAIPKMTFSCCGVPNLLQPWIERGIGRIVLAGIETHVCVLQTALDLMSVGFRVHLAVDATGSRNDLDHETALRRLESSGVTLTTTETVLFEWCEQAGTDEFRRISAIVKETVPQHTPRLSP